MINEYKESFLCLSINYKTSPVEVRNHFSFSNDEINSFCLEIIPEHVQGAVVVSTCNRTEFYFSVSPQKIQCSSISDLIRNMEELICSIKHQSTSEFRKYSFRYIGDDAVKHLFVVTGGLDSMILGENQILGQIRDSYLFSKKYGFVDFNINFIFQHALKCAKRIKTETNLSRTTESIATLAVREIMKIKGYKKILIIGASGQTGSLIVKNLSERENLHVFATVRNHYTLPELGNVEKIPYESRYDCLDDCDVIVSATKSPHYVINCDEAQKHLKSDKIHLFLDLAVPNDIDPDICKISECQLQNIDCFEKIAKQHNEQKKSGTMLAEQILNEELDTTGKELFFYENRCLLEQHREDLEKKTGMQLIFNLKKVANTVEMKHLLSMCQKLYMEGHNDN